MKKYIGFIFFLIVFTINIVSAESIKVSSYEELVASLSTDESKIDLELTNDIYVDEVVTLNEDVQISIDGKGFSFFRENGYLGSFFNVPVDSSLTISTATIDGGAPDWEMDYENYYYTGANNTGYVRVPTINSDTDIIANQSMFSNSGTLSLSNVVVQNSRSTVSGAVISGSGNNNIVASVFKHNGSSVNGGAIYITGGSTIIDNSNFVDNIAGVGVKVGQHGGAIYASGSTMVELKNNTIFESNFAQNNGGALYIINSSILVNNVSFIKNAAGNDGAAIAMTSSKAGDTAYFENIVFEGNKGLALTGQSMGIVWIDNWTVSSEEKPIVFKKCTAFDNISGTGLFTDKGEAYVSIEDCEIYNNNVNIGAAIYSQSGHYNVVNTTIHDNFAKNHSGVIYIGNPFVSVNLDNVSICNNESVGTGLITINGSGNLNIKNSEIYDNKTQKGTITILGKYEEYPSAVVIDNTQIYSNSALEYGGGLYIKDSDGVFTSLSIGEKTKIYSNTAGKAGDDFVYIREDDGTDGDNDITLNNAGSMGINGIDGWYFDTEDSRYADAENPLVYVVDSETGMKILYLKAAGEVELSYDLNGGTSDNEYEVEYTKYGNSFYITDDKPSIANGTFIGWNTKPDGSGYWYYDTDSYNGEHGKVLYAQYKYEEKKYPEITNPETLGGDIITLLLVCVMICFGSIVVYINSGVKLK